MAFWTHGEWTVVPGREDEFIARWRVLAEEALREFTMIERPWLLRDHDRQNVFISFGPWESLEQIDAFRGSEPFHRARADLKDALESFTTRTLDEVARG